MYPQQQIAELVAAELTGFRFPGVRGWAQDRLITPELQLRNWDYGGTGEQFECWLVARWAGGWGIAYCEQGHAGTWGIVSLAELWFGPDSCWFARLEDAFIQSGWEGDLPAGYEVE